MADWMDGSTARRPEMRPWWEAASKKQAGERAQALFTHFYDEDRDRLQAYTAYSRMYTNRDIRGDGYLKAYSAAFALEESEYSRVPLNVAKICLDAAHARVTRPGVRVEFTPSGGNFTTRRKAKQATAFVEHQAHATDLEEVEARASHNGLLYGLGAVKTAPHPVVPEILNECIHPRDIFVDPIEAVTSGKVTHLYQRMFVNRTKLKSFLGDSPHAIKAINEAGRMTDETSDDWAPTADTSLYDMVEVVEGWKLPSWFNKQTGKSSEDGRHVIFVDGTALVFEEWEKPDFPFSFFHWKHDPTMGFFGVGLMEELIGIHFDINCSILHTEKAIEIMPKPFVLLPTGANIAKDEIGNDAGTIIRFTDQAPQIVMPKTVPDDVVNYINVQWQRALQISRLVAMGIAESAGHYLESGSGLKDLVDIQNTEMAPAFKNRQRLLVRLAEQQMVAGRELNERMKEDGEGPFRVVLRKDRNTIMDVDWDNFEFDPKDDSYVVQALPASALGATFGMRLGEVKEMLAAQLISPSQGLRLLDIPDTEAFKKLANADYDHVEMVCEAILDEGESGYLSPEPSMDLRLALSTAKMWLNYAKTIDVPDDRLDLLDEYIRELLALIDKEQEQTRNQAMGIPGQVGAPPALDITGAPPAAAPVVQQQGAVNG